MAIGQCTLVMESDVNDYELAQPSWGGPFLAHSRASSLYAMNWNTFCKQIGINVF